MYIFLKKKRFFFRILACDSAPGFGPSLVLSPGIHTDTNSFLSFGEHIVHVLSEVNGHKQRLLGVTFECFTQT